MGYFPAIELYHPFVFALLQLVVRDSGSACVPFDFLSEKPQLSLGRRVESDNPGAKMSGPHLHVQVSV